MKIGFIGVGNIGGCLARKLNARATALSRQTGYMSDGTLTRPCTFCRPYCSVFPRVDRHRSTAGLRHFGPWPDPVLTEVTAEFLGAHCTHRQFSGVYVGLMTRYMTSIMLALYDVHHVQCRAIDELFGSHL